jgi:hypothetical protein
VPRASASDLGIPVVRAEEFQIENSENRSPESPFSASVCPLAGKHEADK